MRYWISNTAEYGDLTRGKRIITTNAPEHEGRPDGDPGRHVRPRADRGGPRRPGELPAHARRGPSNAIETEGKELRSMMAWIDTEFEEG